jgi:hypothetical protein
MTRDQAPPSRGDGLYVDLKAERCDVTVYTQAWGTDSPPKDGEETNALLHARVFVNGSEIQRAVGVEMFAGADFLTADIRVCPTGFTVVELNEEEWAALTPDGPNPVL